MQNFTAKLRTLDKQSIVNYSLLVVSLVIYAVSVSLAPQVQQQNSLGLNQLQIVILRITIILPYLLTWIIATYSITTLSKYIQRQSTEKDSKLVPVLKAIYNGLIWIVIGLVVTTLIGTLRPYTTAFAPELSPLLSIIVNYSYIFPALLGFFVAYRGIYSLIKSKLIPGIGIQSDNTIKILLVAILAGFYSFLVFTNPHREFASAGVSTATYYLPDILIALTIVLPVVTTWWLGFSVAFMLSDIIPHVSRADFYKAMTKILYGIWSIIFTSILLQALSSLGTARLTSIGLGLLLGLLYIFVIMQCVGYILLALGIRNLQKTKAEST